MEIIMEHKEEKTPVIFGNLSTERIRGLLQENGATAYDKQSRAVFLIRESGTYAGLVTGSYYSQEEQQIKHERFGLVENGWQKAPSPPRHPKLTDAIDVRKQLIEADKDFPGKIESFQKKAKVLSEKNATDHEIDALKEILQKEGFNIGGLIKPKHAEATKMQYFTGYTFENLEEDKQNKTGTRYDTFE